MFKLLNIGDFKVYTIYGSRKDENGNTLFLIWKKNDDAWRWLNANMFRPE